MYRARDLRGFCAALLALTVGLGAAGAAFAYDPEIHQELTFLAAKQLNRCLGDTDGQQLSPLQVRAVASSNVGLADSGFFGKLFSWGYYDPLERKGDSFAWVVSTRFNDHFGALVDELAAAESDSDRLAVLGRIVSYLQLVTSPPRAIPVYAPRFWRWTFSDRFDSYPLQESRLEAVLGDDCSHLGQIPDSYEALLAETAAGTLAAVRGPVGGLPATWESFWALPETPGDFGSYGVAGNVFGRYTEFPCGSGAIHRCVLITDDPAYVAFAIDRQLAAIRATARTMLLFSRSGHGVAGPSHGQTEERQDAR